MQFPADQPARPEGPLSIFPGQLDLHSRFLLKWLIGSLSHTCHPYGTLVVQPHPGCSHFCNMDRPRTFQICMFWLLLLNNCSFDLSLCSPISLEAARRSQRPCLQHFTEKCLQLNIQLHLSQVLPSTRNTTYNSAKLFATLFKDRLSSRFQ